MYNGSYLRPAGSGTASHRSMSAVQDATVAIDYTSDTASDCEYTLTPQMAIPSRSQAAKVR